MLLRLLRDVARVARVALAGDRVGHVAVHHQRLPPAERIEVRGVRIRDEHHVALLDLLEAAHRRAVERVAVLELPLVEHVGRDRHVLHHAGQVAEAQVDELHLLGAHQLQDLVRRSVFHGGAPYFQMCSGWSSPTTSAARRRSSSSWCVVEQPRPVVAHAEGADPAAVGEHQRDAGVEPDAGRTGHRRVVGEPVVLERVGHRRARRRRGWRARRSTRPGGSRSTSNPSVRLEPLPVGVDERDERDRRLGDLAGLLGVAVEPRLRRACRGCRASAGRRGGCSSSGGSGAASHRHARRSTAARSLVRTWAIEHGSTSQSVTWRGARCGIAPPGGAEHAAAAGDGRTASARRRRRGPRSCRRVIAGSPSQRPHVEALGRRPRPGPSPSRAGSLVATTTHDVEVLEGRDVGGRRHRRRGAGGGARPA